MSESNIIIEQLKKQALNFNKKFKEEKIGTVSEVSDGVVKIAGLAEAMSGEMVEFAHGEIGLVLNLEDISVGAVVIGSDKLIKEGQKVKQTGKIPEQFCPAPENSSSQAVPQPQYPIRSFP